MRGYAAVSISELTELIGGEAITPEIIYGDTTSFMAEHSDSDQEEREYMLSLHAAEDSLSEGDFGLIIAFEISDVASNDQEIIELVDPISLSQIEALFTCERGIDEDIDEIELTWFAVQEIETHLNEWKAKK